MASRAELEELVRRKRLEEAVRAQRAQAAAPAQDTAPAQDAAPPPTSGIDTARGALQSTLRGQVLGFGDEIVGAGRTLLDRALPNATYDFGEGARDSRQSMADTYRMYRDDERAVQQQFQDENPGTALGLTVAGGLASPVARLGPGATAATVGGSMARAGAEGALAGYGESTDNPLRDILMGGGMGAGFAGLLGTGLRQLAKRRVEGDLLVDVVDDATGEVTQQFKPLHLVDEEGLPGDLYRGLVGRSYGARQVIRQQEAPWTDPLRARADAMKDESAELKDYLAEAAEGIQARKTAVVQEAQDANQASRAAIRANRAQEQADTVIGLADDQRNLRAVAAQEALPDDFRVTVLQDVDLDDPQAVSRALDDFWKKDAFQMVKQREFNWDEGLIDDLRTQFNNDPALILSLQEAPEMVDAMQRRFGLSDELYEALKSGSATDKQLDVLSEKMAAAGSRKIDGDQLMEMRNFFARQANKGGDNAFAHRRVANQFDGLIKRQLDAVDPKQAEAYRDQLGRWTTHLAYRDATRKAAKEGGRFDAKQWVTSSGKFGDTSTGAAPLQGEATEVLERGRQTAQRQAQAKAADTALERSAADRLRQANRAAAEEATNAKEALQARELRSDLAARMRETRNQLRDINKLAVPEKPSGLSSLLTTSLLGAAAVSPAGPAGALFALPAGIATSRALASKPVQLAVAGQTGAQQALAQALRDGTPDEIARLLGRMAAQGITGD